MLRAITGAAAGCVATVPMSVVMLGIHLLLPRRRRKKIEPKRVSDDLLWRTGVDQELDLSESDREKISLAAHFGYGTACGAVYGLAEPLLPLPRGTRGPAFGTFVWAASYLGWLPAVGTIPPPDRYPLARQMLLIASHLVWGAATEVVTGMLNPEDTGATSPQPAKGVVSAYRRATEHSSLSQKS